MQRKKSVALFLRISFVFHTNTNSKPVAPAHPKSIADRSLMKKPNKLWTRADNDDLQR